MAVILNGILTPVNALQTPLVVDVLKQGSELLSVIGIGELVGMGASSIMFPFISKKIEVLPRMVLSGIFMGISYAGFLAGMLHVTSSVYVYAVTLLASFLFGYTIGVMNSTVNILFMKNVEETYFARVSALLGSLSCMAMPVCSALLSLVVAYVSIPKLFLIMAVFILLIFINVGIRRVQFE